ncbi:hypothetical protein SFUMM280S_00980 [Streptomyces fumanus]
MTGTTGTETVLGAPAERREGREKVTGTARYAAESTGPPAPTPGRCPPPSPGAG